MNNRFTKEPQYQSLLALRDKVGLTSLGLMTNQVWQEDPRRLVFSLSRYKFVSKMLSGKKSVLEVGCADAFGTRIVLQEVKSLVAVDFDPIFVEDVNKRMCDPWIFDCHVHDILEGPVQGQFEAAYALDLIEHIPQAMEETFLNNMIVPLSKNGVLIIGSPSIYSQPYASPPSKLGHVNCKSQSELRNLMHCFFHNVFIFGMNDEVLHTGFPQMAQYIFAIGVGKLERS